MRWTSLCCAAARRAPARRPPDREKREQPKAPPRLAAVAASNPSDRGWRAAGRPSPARLDRPIAGRSCRPRESRDCSRRGPSRRRRGSAARQRGRNAPSPRARGAPSLCRACATGLPQAESANASATAARRRTWQRTPARDALATFVRHDQPPDFERGMTSPFATRRPRTRSLARPLTFSSESASEQSAIIAG